MFKILKYVN